MSNQNEEGPAVEEAVEQDIPEYSVSKWLEMIGNGRYQFWVNVLMGMISFADTAEIAITSIILPNLVCEWDLSTLQKALIPGLVLGAEAVGSFIAGKVADSYGRKSLLLSVFYIIVIASIFSIFSNSYYMYVISRMIASGGIGASYPIANTYIHEFSVVQHRSTGTTTFSLVGAAGGVYACLCALAIMGLPYSWWRLELALVLIPATITLIMLHFADESPRYYAVHGKPEQAMTILQKIAATNNVDLMEGTVEPALPFSNSYLDVYRQPYTRVAVILSILHFSSMYILNGIFYLFPDVMTYGYCDLSELYTSTYTNLEGCVLYTSDQYVFYLILNLLYFPAYSAGGASTELLGRKKTFMWSTWTLFATTLFVLICINYVITIAILLLMFLMVAALVVTTWIYTPESFPTDMRATSCGVLNTVNRIGAAAGAFTTEYVDSYSLYITLLTYVLVTAPAAVAVLFISKETRGTLLVEQEGKSVGYGSIDSAEGGAKEE